MYYLDEERKPLEDMVTAFFPYIEKLLPNLLNNYTVSNAASINAILETYYVC